MNSKGIAAEKDQSEKQLWQNLIGMLKIYFN